MMTVMMMLHKKIYTITIALQLLYQQRIQRSGVTTGSIPLRESICFQTKGVIQYATDFQLTCNRCQNNTNHCRNQVTVSTGTRVRRFLYYIHFTVNFNNSLCNSYLGFIIKLLNQKKFIIFCCCTHLISMRNKNKKEKKFLVISVRCNEMLLTTNQYCVIYALIVILMFSFYN